MPRTAGQQGLFTFLLLGRLKLSEDEKGGAAGVVAVGETMENAFGASQILSSSAAQRCSVHTHTGPLVWLFPLSSARL